MNLKKDNIFIDNFISIHMYTFLNLILAAVGWCFVGFLCFLGISITSKRNQIYLNEIIRNANISVLDKHPLLIVLFSIVGGLLLFLLIWLFSSAVGSVIGFLYDVKENKSKKRYVFINYIKYLRQNYMFSVAFSVAIILNVLVYILYTVVGYKIVLFISIGFGFITMLFMLFAYMLINVDKQQFKDALMIGFKYCRTNTLDSIKFVGLFVSLLYIILIGSQWMYAVILKLVARYVVEYYFAFYILGNMFVYSMSLALYIYVLVAYYHKMTRFEKI